MHHLVLGIDPVPLGSAPFALATDRAVHTTAAALGLTAHPGARVYVLPCIAGHVGADTAGVILAETPHMAERTPAGRRRRHERRDRAVGRAAAARRVEPDRSGVRGRPDQLRPAGRAGRDRAGADRSRDARAALQGDRLRPLVGRSRLRRGDPRDRRHRRLRLRDRGGRSPSSTSHASSPRTGSSTGGSSSERRGSSPTDGRSPTCCTTATPRSTAGRAC